jgi:opacity protein-like surface antigen
MRSVRLLVVLLCALSSLAVDAAVADATTGSPKSVARPATVLASVSCDGARLCLYYHTNFEGWARRFGLGHNENDYDTVNWCDFSSGSCRDTGDGMDNDTSSVINHTNDWVRLYQDEGYQGRVICMGPYSSVHRLAIFEFGYIHTMDNRVSAHHWTRTEACDYRVEPRQNI